jgi:flagellar hook-associated protein 3 FlgL
VDQLGRLTSRQYLLQRQAATGQRLTLPSDDPAAMQRVLDLQTESRASAQFQRNAAALNERARASYQAIRGLKTVSDRANELSILADDTKSPDELKVYAGEVTNLIKQAVHVANAQFRGEHLFSGTISDTPPYALAVDGEGNVTGVAYQGNQDTAESEIGPGVTLTTHTVGENTSGTGPRGLITDTRFGADFFNHLIALQNHLNAGDTAAVAATDRGALQADEENIVLHASDNASAQSRLESAGATARQKGESLETLISNDADADLAETLVRLNQTQNAYQAALQSGARLLQTSLLDYLR